MIKPTRNYRSNKSEFAQTMVEFAIVFPIILLITYGIIEFGRMVFIYTEVTSSAREGARYGAAAGGVIPRYADCAEIRNAVRKTAFFMNIPDANIQIWYDSGPGTATKSTCPAPLGEFDPNRIILGDRIVVRVTGNYMPVVPLPGIPIAGFDITKQNARTILVDVKLEEP